MMLCTHPTSWSRILLLDPPFSLILRNSFYLRHDNQQTYTSATILEYTYTFPQTTFQPVAPPFSSFIYLLGWVALFGHTVADVAVSGLLSLLGLRIWPTCNLGGVSFCVKHSVFFSPSFVTSHRIRLLFATLAQPSFSRDLPLFDLSFFVACILIIFGSTLLRVC